MGNDKTRPKAPSSGARGEAVPPATLTSLPSALERHFSVAEVAALWNLSEDAVRDIFRHEEGVLAIGTVSARGKRRYITLRIPQSVLERVYLKKVLSNQYIKS
jgi:hypothetical protein